MSNENEQAKAYVQHVMARLHVAATALAAKAGISATTLTRPLNDPEHKFALSTSTLGKIAEATGISYLEYLRTTSVGLPEIARSGRPPSSAPVVATVEAGAWREVDELDQSDPEWVTVPADDKFPDATQRVYDVSGDSMNGLKPHPITPGSRIVAVDYDEIAGRYPLRNGLVVVIQRSRNGGQERELSVKQVAWFDDRIEFQPRSTNSKHKPIIVRHDDWVDDGVEVKVAALVRDIIHRLPG
ncbi:MAG: LexA family protein [Devosia sp.]